MKHFHWSRQLEWKVSKWSPCICHESFWRDGGIGVFIRNFSTLMGWVVSSVPRTHYTRCQVLREIYMISAVFEVSQIQYLCILFWVWNMYLMPEDGQCWTKHVACVDESNKICCGWWYTFIRSLIPARYRTMIPWTSSP